MSEPIVYLDHSRIREGHLGTVRRAIAELVEFIDAREPQLLYYAFHIDEEDSRMTVVAVHPDPESLELHMRIGGEAFRRFADHIEMESIEVYGEPSPAATQELRAKSEALGGHDRVVIHPRSAGFARLTAVTT